MHLQWYNKFSINYNHIQFKIRLWIWNCILKSLLISFLCFSDHHLIDCMIVMISHVKLLKWLHLDTIWIINQNILEHSENSPVAGAGSTHCAVHWAPPPDLLRSDVKSIFSPLFLPSLPCISSFIFWDLQNLQLKCKCI